MLRLTIGDVNKQKRGKKASVHSAEQTLFSYVQALRSQEYKEISVDTD